MIEKIENFILNGCYKDSINYRILIEKNNGEFNEIMGQYSYLVEMMIVTIKSIVPSLDEVGNFIDYNRFREELKLWKYYRHGGNSSLLNESENFNKDVYWNKVDKSVYIRLIPIIITNRNYDFAKRVIIKNILYTTGNIKTMLESIALSKLLYLIFNDCYEFDKVVEDIKKEIIHLSQIDFLNSYEKSYKIDISTYPKNYKLEFERSKIEILNLLNGINSNSYNLLNSSLQILKDDYHNLNNIDNNFFLQGIISLINNKECDNDFKDKGFIRNLCTYLIKLRKSRINPKGLEKVEYKSPDIFNYKENQIFKHPLLNNCKVIKRTEKNNYIKSIISTKSGIYRFIKFNN